MKIWQAAEKLSSTLMIVTDIEVSNDDGQPCRMLKKAARQGRSERRAEQLS